MGGLDIRAADLDVNRRRQAQVEHGIDQTAGLEVGADLRAVRLAGAGARGPCIRSCRSCDLLSGCLDESGVMAGVAGVHGGKARAARRCWRLSTPRSCVATSWRMISSTFLTYSSVFFDAGAGRRFQVDDKLAGIGAREIGDAEQRIESQAQQKHARSGRSTVPSGRSSASSSALVTIEQAVKLAIEPRIEARAARIGSAGGRRRFDAVDARWAFDKPRAKERHDGHRDEIRSEQRKHDGQGQGGEQEPADSIQECHRKEHDRGGQRRGQDRHSDFARRLFRRRPPAIRPFRCGGRCFPARPRSCRSGARTPAQARPESSC